MHLYSVQGSIKRYETIEEIMMDFYNYRLSIYQKRKDYMLDVLKHQLKLISFKVKFIKMIVKKEIEINNKKKNDIEDILIKHKFPKLSNSKDEKESYNYLLSMPIYNLTFEKIQELEKQQKNKETEYEDLDNKSIKDIWLEELEYLQTKYNEWVVEKQSIKHGEVIKSKGKKTKK
jgi:DNA topoisomerase-2